MTIRIFVVQSCVAVMRARKGTRAYTSLLLAFQEAGHRNDERLRMAAPRGPAWNIFEAYADDAAVTKSLEGSVFLKAHVKGWKVMDPARFDEERAAYQMEAAMNGERWVLPHWKDNIEAPPFPRKLQRYRRPAFR